MSAFALLLIVVGFMNDSDIPSKLLALVGLGIFLPAFVLDLAVWFGPDKHHLPGDLSEFSRDAPGDADRSETPPGHDT
jgi:hypothetical protein